LDSVIVPRPAAFRGSATVPRVTAAGYTYKAAYDEASALLR